MSCLTAESAIGSVCTGLSCSQGQEWEGHLWIEPSWPVNCSLGMTDGHFCPDAAGLSGGGNHPMIMSRKTLLAAAQTSPCTSILPGSAW